MKVKRIERAQTFLVLLPLLIVVAVLFLPTLSQDRHLFPPVDGSPYFANDFQATYLSSMWGDWKADALGYGNGGRPLRASSLLFILFHSLDAHVLRYVVSVLVMGIGMFLLLRSWSLARWVCAAAATGFALSGYILSLVSAGHAGMFEAVALAVLSLLFVDRAVRNSSVFCYAWSGACAGLGLAAQPDILGMLGMLVGAYWVFLFVRRFIASHGARRHLMFVTVLGILVGGLTFSATALSGSAWVGRRIERRHVEVGKTKAQKWEFATNWSMPPEELVEFVAPCIYGIETGDAKGPYWGRLGRTLGWPRRRGLMNLKQHTLYMGVISLLFAVFAVATLFSSRFRSVINRSESASKSCSNIDKHSAHHVVSEAGLDSHSLRRPEIVFWGIAFLVTVLLALGRNFPLYRLFYSLPIPFVSSIRAPVKFIHLSELALCVLFAFGLASFAVVLANDPARRPRKLLLGMGVGTLFLAILCFLAIAILGNGPEKLQAYWVSLGLEQFAPKLLALMKGALGRSGVLFLLGAALFLAAIKARSQLLLKVLPVILLLVVAIDMGTVAKRYVRTRDVRPWYRSNPVAEAILSDNAGEMGRTAYLLSPTSWRVWVCGNLLHHGVDLTLPMQKESLPDPEYLSYFRALGFDPQRPWPLPSAGSLLRLWQLTNTRYLVGVRKQMAPLVKKGVIEPFEYFNLDTRQGHEAFVLATPQTAGYAVYRVKHVLPRAALYYTWMSVEEGVDGALPYLRLSSWDPTQSVLVAGDLPSPTGSGMGAVDIEVYTATKIVLSLDAEAAGIVLLNDKFDPDWTVELDGSPARLLRCNGIMRGVYVEPGKHTVIMTYRPFMGPFLLSLTGLVILLVWTGVRIWYYCRARARLEEGS